ncbi:hypothetical protein [Pedobacter sp. GR22-6]|uniref:hypothetical protein n=1 Tax=Pedobacter sp. GR22-6 TaxID=3127957 RepID=UPI00307D2C43
MSLTKLQDPSIRLTQYVEAIKFYLEHTTLKIVYIDNSGVDIEQEFEGSSCEGRLETLCFFGNDYDRNLGKGYGEMQIIEYGLEHSLFLKSATFIFKITGRLKVLNINKFADQLIYPSPIEVMVDMKGMLFYADSRFFGGIPAFYEILIGNKNLIDDSKDHTFEQALSKAVCIALIKNYKYRLLKYLPRYCGVSGTLNERYPSGLLYWIPRDIKQRLRYYLMSV